VKKLPYEDDFMEIGNTGWVPVREGFWYNKYTKHTMDEMGREFDESGNLVYDPTHDD